MRGTFPKSLWGSQLCLGRHSAIVAQALPHKTEKCYGSVKPRSLGLVVTRAHVAFLYDPKLVSVTSCSRHGDGADNGHGRFSINGCHC